MEKQAPSTILKKIDRARRWLPQFSLKPSLNLIPIKVLSYNILADSNVKYTMDFYPGSAANLEWKRKRCPMIIEYIRRVCKREK